MLPLFDTDDRLLDRSLPLFSGDFTHEVTLVPIPNTTVKLMRPMIVPTSAKVGHCRNFSKDRVAVSAARSFFVSLVHHLL